MARPALNGQPMTVAERQRRFRIAQKARQQELERAIRSASTRIGEASVSDLGRGIAQMSEKWGETHLSVRDRVLLLARRFELI